MGNVMATSAPPPSPPITPPPPPAFLNDEAGPGAGDDRLKNNPGPLEELHRKCKGKRLGGGCICMESNRFDIVRPIPNTVRWGQDRGEQGVVESLPDEPQLYDRCGRDAVRISLRCHLHWHPTNVTVGGVSNLLW